MAVEIEVREFTISTGTGNIDFTGFGFQPKACMFFYSSNATDNADSSTSDGKVRSIGMCDGTREWAMCSASEDNQANADVGRRSTTSGCILRADEGSGSQGLLGKATFVSFLSDGVRVNRTTAFTSPTSPLVRVVAFGGSDVSVYGDIFNPNDTLNGTTSTTAVGFEADLLMTSMINNHVDSDGNSNNDDDSFSVGWAVNPDRQAANNTFSIMAGARDAPTAMETAHMISNNRCCTSVRDNATDAGIEITAWSSNGFTATTRDKAFFSDGRFFFLALKLGGSDAKIYTVNTDCRTTTGDQVNTAAGFLPIFMMDIMISTDTAVNTLLTSGSASSMGFGFADGTRQMCQSEYDDDARSTSECKAKKRNTKFFSVETMTGTVLTEGTLKTFDTNGFTVNFSTTSSPAKRACYLAIGDVAGATTLTKTFTMDIVIEKELTKTFTMDVVIQKELTKTFTIDVVLTGGSTVTKTFTIDTVIQKPSLTKTFTIDVIIQKPSLTKTFTIDTILLKELTKTFTMDVVIQKPSLTKTFTMDVIIQEASLTKTFTIDTVLQKEITKTFTIDVVIKALSVTKTFTMDVVISLTAPVIITKAYSLFMNKLTHVLHIGELTHTNFLNSKSHRVYLRE